MEHSTTGRASRDRVVTHSASELRDQRYRNSIELVYKGGFYV